METMIIRRIAKAGTSHPFGDARTVQQAFPSGVDRVEADPFLMCDFFSFDETGASDSSDDYYPVDWHPHRGFDIASYLKSGVGRHADSLGNREVYATPGVQWMSTGSGIEHAEGGGNPVGTTTKGFQIWINVPSKNKMDDPRYGTVPPEKLPQIDVSKGVRARVLAGEALGVEGPFESVQPVQMIDFELDPNASLSFNIKEDLNTTMIYVYEGMLSAYNESETVANAGTVVVLDAIRADRRRLNILSGEDGASVMLFAGKKLREPIAWHGPIVMNTEKQILESLKELRSGSFPPKRVDWDYKHIASKPKEIK